MDRIIAADTVPLSQADRAPPAGQPGLATDGNPATGLPPTQWPAYAWNMVSEEMREVILAAGIAPSGNNWAQLLAALRVLFGGGGEIGATGWQYLPGRLIVNWGTTNATTGQQEVVPLRKPYPNAHIFALAWEANVSGWENNGQLEPRLFGTGGKTLSDFRVTIALLRSGQPPAFGPATGFSYLSLGI